MVRRPWIVAACLTALMHSPAFACSLCGNAQQMLTFRQEAGQGTCRIVFYGTVVESDASPTGGTSKLRIDAVLKNDPFLGDKKEVVLPRYLPVLNPKDPPKFLVFCDVFKDRLDPYRGVPVDSAAAVQYVKGALALDPKDSTRRLIYFFEFLEHPDKRIAEDAFLEFAKSTDQEVGQASPRLSAAKLRGWLKDAKTPDHRVGMYAFLLGGCGGADDAALLQGMLQKSSDEILKAYDGILAGYIQLRPREGWDTAMATLRDGGKPFRVRDAVLRTLSFYHGWKPQESRTNVLRGLAAVLGQNDLADLGIEYLRRWQMWDLTDEVMALYGKKGFDAPLLRRKVIEYALTCPKPQAAAFVAERRKQEPELVRDVEESIRYQKPAGK